MQKLIDDRSIEQTMNEQQQQRSAPFVIQVTHQ